MQLPNITQAQVAAFIAAAAGVATALFKLNITDAQQAAVVAAIVSVYALAHMISDSVIRNGRSRALAPGAPSVPVLDGNDAVLAPPATDAPPAA